MFSVCILQTENSQIYIVVKKFSLSLSRNSPKQTPDKNTHHIWDQRHQNAGDSGSVI